MSNPAETLRSEIPHFYDDVYNFALYSVCSYKKASKLTSDVISDAAEFLTLFAGGDVKKWLLRICYNLYLKFYTVPGDGKPDYLEIEVPDYVDRVLLKDIFRKLDQDIFLRKLAEVPTDFRIPLVLRDILNLDYNFMTELLDIPQGTVILRLAQGRIALYNKLIDVKP